MPDAGEIKAKVIIEYDDSGLQKAKEDLASLADASKGTGDASSELSDNLSQVEKQATTAGEAAKQLASNISEVPQIAAPASDAIAHMNEQLAKNAESLQQGQTAVEDITQGFQALAPPIEETAKQLTAASAPLMAITEAATATNEQLAIAAQSHQDLYDIARQTTLALPAVADSLHIVEGQATVLSDSLAQATPLIQQHADGIYKLGQNWREAIGIAGPLEIDSQGRVVGEGARLINAAIESNIASANAGSESFINLNDQMKQAGETARNAPNTPFFGTIPSFRSNLTPEQEAMLAAYKSGAMESGVDHEAMIGEMDAFYGNKALGGYLEGISPMKSMGIGEGISGLFGGLMEGLNSVATPLMALQIIGQTVGMVATGIYDAASVAEGPAAHSFGTFTGTVDALGQTAQRASQSFSEGFGQGFLPVLQAINSETNKGDMSGPGGLGQFIGTTLSLVGGSTSVGLGVTLGNAELIKGGYETLVNQFDQMTGQPMQYQGPGPVEQAQIQANQARTILPTTVSALAINAQTQADQFQYMANDPTYLQNQDYLTASQQYYARQQQRYNASHYISPAQIAQDAQEQAYDQQVRGAMLGGPLPYTPGSWTETYQSPTTNALSDLMGSVGRIWQSIFGSDGQGFSSGGCFPSGVLILLADGIECPIERIVIGDRVRTHNGIQCVSNTMKFAHKNIYTVIFEDNSILRLTDSHPIATSHGWASINPSITEQEHPGIDTLTLLPGMDIHTYASVQKRIKIIILEAEPRTVYNIEVENAHTYYADHILVHNMAKTSFAVDNNGSTTLQAHVNWQADNLEHTFQGAATWIADGLSHMFQGAADWAADGLSHMFQGTADWIADSLQHSFIGQAFWQGVDLVTSFVAQAVWQAYNLEKEFAAAASWIGNNLEHEFVGIATWIGQGLSQTFTAVANWIGPAFASGVEGFAGGAAMVGEQGPELVVLPSGASVYPIGAGSQGSSVSPLSMGGSQQQTPQVVNISVMLDSQQFIGALGIPLSQNIRVSMGGRSI